MKTRQPRASNRFWLAWALIAVAAFGTLAQTALRWRYEHSFGRVQIVLDYDDVEAVADAAGVPGDRMLRALRGCGATGLAVNEQTLALLRDSGRLTVVPRARALALFPSLRRAFTDERLQYLAWNSDDARLVRDVELRLGEQSPRDGPVRAVSLPGGARGLLLPASSQLLNDASLGYDWTHVDAARRAGLRPVALLANRVNMNAPRLAARLDEARATGARLVLFDDDEVPGYNTLFKQLAAGLAARGLSYGIPEFAAQRGSIDVAEAGDGNLYRVHAVAPGEATKWRRDELADRYARAARERNVRVLFVRLLRHPQTAANGRAENLLATNTQFVQLIRQKLGEAPAWAAPLQRTARGRDLTLALGVGESGPFLDFPHSVWHSRFGGAAPLLQRGVLWICGLGALGVWLLLANLFFDLTPRARMGLMGVGLLAVTVLVAAGITGVKLLAFGAATAWPVVAFAWGGWPELMRAKQFCAKSITTALLRTLALSLGGGLMIAALLCDWRFLSRTAEFWGTKPAQLLPLAFATALVVGEWSPREVAKHGVGAARRRFGMRLNRALDGGFTIGVAALVGLVAFTLWLWMARSGNDSGLEVSTFEWRLRAALENWMMARPRNKELFGAYPAFIVSFWCAARGWKKPAYALGIIAVIAPIDILNSFCQASNPLALSLWRSVLGAVFGGLIGALTVALLHAPRASLRPSRAQLRLAVTSVLLVAAVGLGLRHRADARYAELTAPVVEATWPWPHATREELSTGVTHWFDKSARDGTTLDLLEFDFARDPRLRFGLYDRDEDDAKPFDNRVKYWDEGLAPTVEKM
ncbi:MAG TPA: DUF5693 family protein, partial [Abditibacteriaceae bacterium]